MKKGRVFSGARPTGRQHLGNYFGAIRNYVALQEDYDCVYCAVDLHALTSLVDTSPLRDYTYEMILDWLAAGIDPTRTIVFVQSHVPQVTELYALLGMVTPLGWLTRLPTFKDKVREQPDNVNYGLVGYPVLMAADILLYKADAVPVGIDQAPHLEFTREIVRRFNARYGEVLVEPQMVLTEAPKILGLDGVSKMSKSLERDNSIELADSPEDIRRKVMGAVTDPARLYKKDPGHPEVCNIFTLHRLIAGDEARMDQIARDCRGATLGCVEHKRMFAAELTEFLAPFREIRQKYADHPDDVWDILRDGAARARAIASQTLDEVKRAVRLP